MPSSRQRILSRCVSRTNTIYWNESDQGSSPQSERVRRKLRNPSSKEEFLDVTADSTIATGADQPFRTPAAFPPCDTPRRFSYVAGPNSSTQLRWLPARCTRPQRSPCAENDLKTNASERCNKWRRTFT